jgi:hypothetical protein
VHSGLIGFKKNFLSCLFLVFWSLLHLVSNFLFVHFVLLIVYYLLFVECSAVSWLLSCLFSGLLIVQLFIDCSAVCWLFSCLLTVLSFLFVDSSAVLTVCLLFCLLTVQLFWQFVDFFVCWQFSCLFTFLSCCLNFEFLVFKNLQTAIIWLD